LQEQRKKERAEEEKRLTELRAQEDLRRKAEDVSFLQSIFIGAILAY
jgi:hypothetical protein